MNRVEKFAEGLAGDDIVPLGTIVNMYRTGTTTHDNTLRRLRADARKNKVPELFQSMIPLGDNVAAAAEFVSSSTLRQRWGYQGHYDRLEALADELSERAERTL